LWVGRAKCAPYSHFCAILPIDFLARRPQLRAAEFTIIPHRPVFVKRKFAQTLAVIFPVICAFCQLDFWGVICYNHNCQEEVPTRDTKMGDKVHRVKKVLEKSAKNFS
jgi:hypothetical protein